MSEMLKTDKNLSFGKSPASTTQMMTVETRDYILTQIRDINSKEDKNPNQNKRHSQIRAFTNTDIMLECKHKKLFCRSH